MNATIKLENEKHFPVLLEKLISIISPLYGGTFIDCTFGQGGYSKKILENKYNNIIAIDRDVKSLEISKKFEKKYKNRFKFENIKFSEINRIKTNKNILKGIIFDLGYSTAQIKDPEKGLSFLSKGKLNMQMGLNEISANEAIDMVLEEQFILSPINFENTQVGTLALLISERLYEEIDLAFARSNNQTLRFSAIAGLLFAAIISLVLPMNMTGPIRKLGRGTRSLISGEFKTRVSIKNRDELGKLSRDFNILAKTLDKNSESQKQWLADISHELRTPIAILKSELEAVEDGIREFDKETLQSLTHEVKRINNLVNDLYELTLADLGAMKYQMREMNIGSCLKEVIESHQERLESSGIEINESIDTEVAFLGDSYRLEQLFTNLIENTLRYTDSPGKLEILLSENKEKILITFNDSAPSVDHDVLDKIFDRFFREELSRSREKGGAGLGLAICHEIVEAHSGEIKATPSACGGLSIQVTLPKGDS